MAWTAARIAPIISRRARPNLRDRAANLGADAMTDDTAEYGAEDLPDSYAIYPSDGFADWLAEVGGSIVLSSYQSGKVFLVGTNPDGRLRANERSFRRGMGIALSEDARRMYIATRQEIYRLDNILDPGSRWSDDSDAFFVPRRAWVTGGLDIHDIGLDGDETPVFANTLFNCLGRAEEGYSFRPLWRAPFISELAAGDRCHLNGLAMESGRPRYVTAVAESDVVDGWRQHRADGGVVIDLASGGTVARGLSMPHSPRLHGGRLWVLDSGHGTLATVDLATGKLDRVARCHGFARGLDLVGHYALIGLSLPRYNSTFQGLPIDDDVAAGRIQPRCGVSVIDLDTGAEVAGLMIEGRVREIYDVKFLPDIKKPSLLGPRSKDLHGLINVAPPV